MKRQKLPRINCSTGNVCWGEWSVRFLENHGVIMLRTFSPLYSTKIILLPSSQKFSITCRNSGSRGKGGRTPRIMVLTLWWLEINFCTWSFLGKVILISLYICIMCNNFIMNNTELWQTSHHNAPKHYQEFRECLPNLMRNPCSLQYIRAFSTSL